MTDSYRANILVVDDEEYVCNIIEESLSQENYDVTVTSDPTEALATLQEKPIDLVLSDLVMGEYSGIQVMDAAQAIDRDIIVILMTAHPTVQTAISVLKKGAYDFMVKPFKLEVLKATIRRGLEHQRIKRENLQLKEQVAFLKIANNCSDVKDLEHYLKMVAHSCLREMSAQAVGIIQVDPETREKVRVVSESEGDQPRPEVVNLDTVEKFALNRNTQPVIESRPTGIGKNRTVRTFISQPIYVGKHFYGAMNILLFNRFESIRQGQLNVLTILTNSAASAMANYRLYQDLRGSYLQAIHGLANAIEARDSYTAGHTDRVSRIAEAIARHLGWSEIQIHHLHMGCTLHDIGKIGVPDSILNKPGRLTDEEQAMMQSHPLLGLKIIEDIDLFKPAIPYIIAHHERYDGRGYPKGLKGEEIPIEGRLLTVADTLDAILSNRPYRDGASLEVAVSELVNNRGTQFDPYLVDVAIEIILTGKVDLEAMYGHPFDVESIRPLISPGKAPV
ncbi:response regulator [candidate division GN15 bacterium]|nr:response regulator [candidate division GN15 bacterium]